MNITPATGYGHMNSHSTTFQYLDNMAEGGTLERKSLEQLEKEITCAVCQKHYTEPKILPCLHYYCKKCILKLALRTGSRQPFSCPECLEETTLPEGDIDQLKTAFFVNCFKSNFSFQQRVHGKVEVMCGECTESGDKAEAFCHQCAVFICRECVRQHKRMKSFSSHEVVSLEDLKQGRAKELATKEPPTKKCDVHEEPLIIFCSDCNSLICRDCTVKTHKDHEFEFSKVAAPDTKKKLLDHLSPLKSAVNSLSSAIGDIQNTKQEIEAQGKSLANTIHTSFAQFQLVLQQRKQQLLHEAASRVEKKIDKLSAQEKKLTLANAQVQRVVDYTERFVSDCSTNEVMNMQTEIRRRIEREVEKYSKSEKSLEPVEEADTGVEVGCVEDLQRLCQAKANITRLAVDPAKCTVRGEGRETAEVGETAEVTLTTKLTNNVTPRRSVAVVSEFKSLWDGSIVQCTVDQSGPGEYNIKYTPTVRGRHELTVLVDCHQVESSPFSVSVSISPTQLGKPVKVWTGPSYPHGVTVNSEGEVIVCELDGDIIKQDKEGKKHVIINYSTTTLSRLSDVATDKEDNIYCTDWNTNKVLRCDKNGRNVRVYEVQQMNVRGHRGVSIVGDEVMLCDYSSGGIMIYNRELKYMRRIVHEDMGQLTNLSSDSHGNLYVTDWGRCKIRVFSNDGVLLRSFDVNMPRGVCVSGQYVYVSRGLSDNVSVFTTTGHFVTSFGKRGHEEGEFIYPRGICADTQHNFIYVCDHINHRVQCF